MLGIISHFKRVRDNNAACEDLAAQIGALTDALKASSDTIRAQALPPALVNAQLGSSVEFANRIVELQQRLDEVGVRAAALRKQEGLKRFALANRNADILKEMSEAVRRAREDFMARAFVHYRHAYRADILD